MHEAFVVAGALADGLHGHGRQGRARNNGGANGRRPVQQRQQQQQFVRSGRQEELPAYAEDAPAGDDAGVVAPIASYGANDAAAGAGDDNLAMLEKSIPGVPGQDYPILAEVPDSAFTCDGQVDGGNIQLYNTNNNLLSIFHQNFRSSNCDNTLSTKIYKSNCKHIKVSRNTVVLKIFSENVVEIDT